MSNEREDRSNRFVWGPNDLVKVPDPKAKDSGLEPAPVDPTRSNKEPTEENRADRFTWNEGDVTIHRPGKDD